MINEQLKNSLKGKQFNAILILNDSVTEETIKNNLEDLIVEKYSAIYSELESSEIKINNFAYVEAKPQKWLINVEWEVK